MKKYLFLFVGMLFAWPVSAGLDVSQTAVAEKLVIRQFTVVSDDANQCRELLEGRKYKDAVATCSKALELYNKTMSYAKQHKVDVRPALATSNMPFITDPLILFPDLQEDLLFARVMKGDLQLSQALQENAALVSNGGFVGYLRGANKRMPNAYYSVAETFRTWKGCKKALTEAQSQVAVSVDFCE